jgi:glycerophosphoryl diester phosphodiesterase
VLVGTWTVDDPGAARSLAEAGADIIITNVPDVVLAAVTRP